jgi:hypothetical protein
MSLFGDESRSPGPDSPDVTITPAYQTTREGGGESELQIFFYFKEYSPPDFEIKGCFAFQKKSRGYLVNSQINFLHLL